MRTEWGKEEDGHDPGKKKAGGIPAVWPRFPFLLCSQGEYAASGLHHLLRGYFLFIFLQMLSHKTHKKMF